MASREGTKETVTAPDVRTLSQRDREVFRVRQTLGTLGQGIKVLGLLFSALVMGGPSCSNTPPVRQCWSLWVGPSAGVWSGSSGMGAGGVWRRKVRYFRRYWSGLNRCHRTLP